MTSGSKSNSIGPASAGARLAALTLLLGDLSDPRQQAEHLLATLPADQWRGLLVARDRAEIDGAVWAQDIGGGAIMIWPPRLNSYSSPSPPFPPAAKGEVASISDRLTDAAVDYAAASHCRLVQALLSADADVDTELFLRHGFQRLANLAYLACDIERVPQEFPSSELQVSSAGDVDDARFAAVVEQTYQGTLDLPELNGQRTGAEVIAEYRSAPQYDPTLWFLARHENRDVGCLILNDHADLGQLELVYVGLAPAARGKRWGQTLVRFAQQQARRRGRRQLLLAVSAENRPALEMYGATGFFVWQQRRTLVRTLAEK